MMCREILIQIIIWRMPYVHAKDINLWRLPEHALTYLAQADAVAVVDTHDDTLLGPWDTNPFTTNGRVHAGVFSNDERTLYLANEGANEVVALDPRTGFVFWRMTVPAAHELAVTHNEKWGFVSRRTANKLAVINLEDRTFTDVLTLSLPDALKLSANEKLLTVGLRTG